jgi:hypothetical protein
MKNTVEIHTMITHDDPARLTRALFLAHPFDALE